MSKPLPQRNDADALREARALIDRPQKWHRGGHIGDARHCAIQALDRATYTIDYGHTMRRCEAVLRDAVQEMDGHTSVVKFNDTHTHAEVLALFDRAIELAEESR